MLAVIRSPKIASDNLWEVSTTARVLGSDLRQVLVSADSPARLATTPPRACRGIRVGYMTKVMSRSAAPMRRCSWLQGQR